MGDVTQDDAYKRAQHDPTFLRAVRAAHAGEWDVLDALWWRGHPMDAAPRGTPSPAARRAELQRRVFSVDGDAAGSADASRALHDLTAEIAGEKRAIESALAAAQRPSATLVSHRDPEAPPATAEAAKANLGALSTVPEQPTSRTRSRVLIAAVAALIGVVVGWQVHAATADAVIPAAAASSPSPSAPPAPALAVFDRPQEPGDIPGVPVRAEFEPASFRFLTPAFGSDDSAENTLLYAAKTTSGLVCMLGVTTADDYLATCTLAQQFPAIGLRLYWPTQLTSRSAGGTEHTVVMDTQFTWKHDGDLEGGGYGQRLPQG